MLTTQGRSQEHDVASLILGDLNQVLVEWVGETSIEELLVGVVGQTLTVEGVLEVLKGKSIVEDIGYGSCQSDS